MTTLFESILPENDTKLIGSSETLRLFLLSHKHSMMYIFIEGRPIECKTHINIYSNSLSYLYDLVYKLDCYYIYKN